MNTDTPLHQLSAGQRPLHHPFEQSDLAYTPLTIPSSGWSHCRLNLTLFIFEPVNCSSLEIALLLYQLTALIFQAISIFLLVDCTYTNICISSTRQKYNSEKQKTQTINYFDSLGFVLFVW